MAVLVVLSSSAHCAPGPIRLHQTGIFVQMRRIRGGGVARSQSGRPGRQAAAAPRRRELTRIGHNCRVIVASIWRSSSSTSPSFVSSSKHQQTQTARSVQSQAWTNPSHIKVGSHQPPTNLQLGLVKTKSTVRGWWFILGAGNIPLLCDLGEKQLCPTGQPDEAWQSDHPRNPGDFRGGATSPARTMWEQWLSR